MSVKRWKTEDEFWDDYKSWLIDKLDIYDEEYSMLLDQLHNTPFIFSIEKDVNRAEDGKEYRNDYLSDISDGNRQRVIESGVFEERECSVLEMLAGLATRIDREYTGVPGEDGQDLIFYDMIENLGLMKYRDNCYNSKKVDDILEKWMDRRFDFDGKGSIFPLRNTNRDQRKIEIWSQMSEYLSENF